MEQFPKGGLSTRFDFLWTNDEDNNSLVVLREKKAPYAELRFSLEAAKQRIPGKAPTGIIKLPARLNGSQQVGTMPIIKAQAILPGSKSYAELVFKDGLPTELLLRHAELAVSQQAILRVWKAGKMLVEYARVAGGRPPGITETFTDKADFDNSVGKAIRAVKARKEHASEQRVVETLFLSDVRQLRRCCRTFGYERWKDVLDALSK